MHPIYEWFQNNLDFVFFVYGMTFLILGLSILLQPKKGSQFKLARILWLFACYCLIHSLSDFINMGLLIKGQDETLYYFAKILTYLSFIFLFEFGRNLLRLVNKNVDWRILPIIFFIIISVSLFYNNFWVNIDIFIGYFVRVPGGVMGGVGFFFYYKHEKDRLDLLKVKKYFYVTGATLLIWTYFCGIIRSKGDFFPANILNSESFFLFTNVPVYLFRSICGLIIAWALIGSLKIFDWEVKKKLIESEKKYREAYYLANFYKDLFAHDMNNILQAIISSADFYSIFRNDPEKLKKLGDIAEVARNHARRGASLVSNVMKLSKLDEKEAELRSTEIFDEFNKSVEHTVSTFQERNVKIDVNGLSKDMKVLSNELLIDIFDNLLNNAVKYNDNEKEVKVDVDISKIQEEDMLYIKFEFTDYGMGVPDERKETLFEKSYNKDISQREMGMGLSLVKKIVDKYGGKIWVEDRVKGDYTKGSNFVVKLQEA